MSQTPMTVGLHPPRLMLRADRRIDLRYGSTRQLFPIGLNGDTVPSIMRKSARNTCMCNCVRGRYSITTALR